MVIFTLSELGDHRTIQGREEACADLHFIRISLAPGGGIKCGGGAGERTETLAPIRKLLQQHR